MQHHAISQLLNPNDPLKHSQIMDKLKQIVFNMANSNPDKPLLTPSQISLIENGLLRTFSSLKPPTHPAYAAMIHNAIVHLVGKGSLTTEGKISEYMIKKYEGLPWAHERYLKHHLDKLCGFEELIYDDIEGTYSLPEETKRKSPRRKLVKQKMLSRFKEDVVEVGNSAREELDELSDSGVGFQEGALQQLGKGKRKRKRKHIYDEEDDEGVQASVIEPRKVFFQLNGREVKNWQLEQCNSRMSDEDHELVDVSEGTSTPKLDMVCSNEVNNQVLPVNNVVSERRNEPEMSVLPPNTAELPRVVPVKSVNESNLVRDLVLAPDIEDPLASVEKSDSKEREQNLYASELMIMPYKDNPQNSVLPPDIEDPLSSVEKSNSKEREQNPFASELTIVPYKDNPENSPTGIPSFRSVDPIIICGLFIPKDEREIKKIQVYHTRKRSKPSQGKTKALKEEPVLASLDLSMQTSPESKVKRKSQSPKLKGLPLLENDSATQLANQKSSHPIHLGNISMEDKEPLQQVIEKYGYRKKHEALGAMSEVASALSSSKAGAHLRKELPGFENSVEMTPTMEQETALRERTGKQLDLELISQHKNCDNVEDNTCRKLSSNSLDESGTKDSGKAENQRTENLGLGNAERSLLQVSDHNLQGPTATFGQATESALDWGSHRLIEGPNFHYPENPSILKETAEEFKIPSLFVELHQKGEGPSELTRRDALDNQHSKREKQHMLLLTKSDRAGNKGTSPDEDDQERPLKVKEPTPKCEGYLSDLQNHVQEGLPEVAPYQHSQKLNEQLDNSQQLKRKRGRPRKSNMSIIKDEADSLVISNPTTYQFPDNQNKQGKLINEQLSLKDALDPSSLHLDEQERATLATVQQNDGVRTRKQRATQKDTTDLLDTHLKEQERHLQNQNKQLGKIDRVRALRSKEDAFQALNLREQQGRNSAAGCRYEQLNKLFKKDGRGKPRKKEDKAEEYGIYFKNMERTNTMSEPANCFRGRCKGKITVTEEHTAVKSNHLLDVGLSESVDNQQSQLQSIKPKRGRRNLLKEEDRHDKALLSLSHEVQCPEQGWFISASHVTPEASLTQNQDDLKESLPAASDHISRREMDPSAMEMFVASTYLVDQSSQRHKDQNQPRCQSTRILEVTKASFDFQNEQLHVIPEAPSTQSQVDLKEILLATSDHVSHLDFVQMETSEASTCLADQSSQHHKDQTQPNRRSTRISGAKKVVIDSQNEQPHLIPEPPLPQSQVHLKESVPPNSDDIGLPEFEQSAMETSETSICSADPSSQLHMDQDKPKRRSTRNSGAVISFMDSENEQPHEILETLLTQSQFDVKESLPETRDHITPPDFELSAMETSEASSCLANQSSQRHMDQNQLRRRSTRNSGATKTYSVTINDKHELKLSDQSGLAKPPSTLRLSDHHCSEEEYVDLENKVHGKPVELEQSKRTLDYNTHHQGRLPPSKLVISLSNNQNDQEQPEDSHDPYQESEEMEDQVKLPIEMTPKSASTYVPLSSKDQLRSRIKRQSFESA